MFSNSNSNIATTVAAAAAAANTRSSSVTSRSSPYNYAAAGAAAYGTNVNMHHHQNPQSQDYSMYTNHIDPTMAWHATYAAAAYRGYEAATAASEIWPPQSYPHAAHMNMLPNNSDLNEAASSSLNLAAAESNFLAASNSGVASAASASNPRSNSPSEYKVFNNNESRENEVKPLAVRPSPDSGLAEAMSASGSPNNGHNVVSQGSPIPGSNLVVRPSAARSPYEWMRKPSNGLQARPKEGKISHCGYLFHRSIAWIFVLLK